MKRVRLLLTLIVLTLFLSAPCFATAPTGVSATRDSAEIADRSVDVSAAAEMPGGFEPASLSELAYSFVREPEGQCIIFVLLALLVAVVILTSRKRA